jgi:hypothetical protein
MEHDEGFLKNLTIWLYSRGTLQYDIICILILAFIFFVPPSCFVKGEATTQSFHQNAPNDAFVGMANPEAQRGLRNLANPITAP